MSPQLPEPKVPQQHPAPELGGLKLLWVCLNEVGHWPKAMLYAVGPTLSLNIWPAAASLTPWLPDLHTAEAEASSQKARAKPTLAVHTMFGPK